MTKSIYVRNMLQGYDRQLVSARRLARYRRSLQIARGEDLEPSIPPEVKRRELVERVAREVVENLIISGSENPMVQSIKDSLQDDLGQRLHFTYPPSDHDVQIFKETPDGTVEVGYQEKGQILHRLWKITLDKVDATML